MRVRYEFSFERAESIDVDIDASGLAITVVPVAFSHRGSFSMQGTAFCVAGFISGDVIFATAKHVVSELAETRETDAFILLPRGLDTKEDRRSLIGVRIHQVALAESYSDVAFVVANPKNSELSVVTTLKCLPVTFGPPEVGQHCMALGYPQEPGANSYEMRASRGTIEEVHPRRRDNVMSTFPSFRTNALYKPGMSGGPIIDTSGRVIGIVSHGTEAHKLENVTGYGASIGAIVEMKLDLVNNAGEIEEFAISQLADMGFLGNRRDPAVTLSRNDDGVTLTWAASDGTHGDPQPDTSFR